jgi:general secretion pathway protein J
MLARNGFTLVELLVALTIFALLAAAGVSLLSISVTTQGQVKARLNADAGVGRSLSLLGADLAQAEPRSWRDSSGASRGALSLGQDGALVTFVSNGGASGESKRVSLRQEGGKLLRLSVSPVDGDAKPARATLASGLTSATVRVRSEGQWSSDWRPTAIRELPSALELTMETGAGPVRMLFLVGAGQR